MNQPHPGIVRVVIMLVSGVSLLFVLTSFAVLLGALGTVYQLGDGETSLLLVLGTGLISLVSAGLGAYFGIENDQPLIMKEQRHEQ